MTLEWLAAILGVEVPALVAEAQESPAGAAGVYFMPHLRGGGTSNIDAKSTALFYGLTDYTTRANLARAALEGVCYEMALKFDFAREAAGVKLERMRSVGGGARSELWNQLKADVTGLPVEVPKVREATACGAALLAGIAVGAFENWQEAAGLIPAEKSFSPDAGRHAEYRKRLESVYSRLYPAVKGFSAL
ncbi:MAG: hypothetical protein GTO21_01605 [Armatimonadetes bacterium]|nr:hypothetical protein [Armatimonadota bacterium]